MPLTQSGAIPDILALIPARSGSKSLPDKNIRQMAGKPMLAWSVAHAKQSKFINKIIVSTDNELYRQIALKYGAEAPFLRPPELATDISPDVDVFCHTLNWLKEHQDYEPLLCVHLRPTCPIRRARDIDHMIEIMLKDASLDSVRSVVRASEIPYKMWNIGSEGLLEPVVRHLPEPYNQPRQTLPLAYYQNAAIDVVRTTTILRQHSMTGRRIFGYIMPDYWDIDHHAELAAAKQGLAIQTGRLRFCFDIDGVLASLAPDNNYVLAEPLHENIALVNALFCQGHHITLFTARGSATGLDWRELTVARLSEWGVQYHELLFGKPAADFYLDDKFIDLRLLKLLTQEVAHEL